GEPSQVSAPPALSWNPLSRLRAPRMNTGRPMRLIDLGSDVAYEDGLEKMRHTMARVDDEGPALLLIEHRPTITITRRGGVGAFVSPRERIEADGIDVVEAD